LLQPIVVRPAEGDRFELIAGERRWRAAQRAGLHRIPAVVREVPDDAVLELALVENLEREDLNPMEEASAYRTLTEALGLTQQQVAERVGRQRATIANTLRLLTLPKSVQDRVRRNELSGGQARAIASLAVASEQERLAEKAVREGLSVRQLERLVSAASAEAPKGKPRSAARRDPNVVAAEQNLQRALGTRVRIFEGAKGGRIELQFFNREDLQRVYQALLDVARRKP
jgi:ParB family chromosome partitioning protein